MDAYMKMHIAISSQMGKTEILKPEKRIFKNEVTNISKLNSLAELVAKEFKISKDDIKSKNRRPDIVEARQIFCYLARSKFNTTLLTISEFLNKHHTSVLHSLRATAERIATNHNDINNTINNLEWSYMMES